MQQHRKGIILAGGHGTRLYPMTQLSSKHLLPVYDKPMVYYPLTTLMSAGIQDILIISPPRDLADYQALLGDGKKWGLNITYKEQQEPKGIAEAFILGESFIDGHPVTLILGDNIFYSEKLTEQLLPITARKEGATVFAYKVHDPRAFGVIDFDKQGRAIKIEEKPLSPSSPYAVPGFYFFDADASDIAKTLQPSARGELEITDMQQVYLERGDLLVDILGDDFKWFDTGTPKSLLSASAFVQSIEEQHFIKLACPEELAYRMGYIQLDDLAKLAAAVKECPYSLYLKGIVTKEGRI